MRRGSSDDCEEGKCADAESRAVILADADAEFRAVSHMQSLMQSFVQCLVQKPAQETGTDADIFAEKNENGTDAGPDAEVVQMFVQ